MRGEVVRGAMRICAAQCAPLHAQAKVLCWRPMLMPLLAAATLINATCHPPSPALVFRAAAIPVFDDDHLPAAFFTRDAERRAPLFRPAANQRRRHARCRLPMNDALPLRLSPFDAAERHYYRR